MLSVCFGRQASTPPELLPPELLLDDPPELLELGPPLEEVLDPLLLEEPLLPLEAPLLEDPLPLEDPPPEDVDEPLLEPLPLLPPPGPPVVCSLPQLRDESNKRTAAHKPTRRIIVHDQSCHPPATAHGPRKTASRLDSLLVSISLPFVAAYQIESQLDALGDPTRRAIFQLLAKRPLAVVDIARTLPVSRPAVSQHLKVLKDAGLVKDTADGTRHVYRLDPQGLVALRRYFDQFWTEAIEAFRDEIENPTPAGAVGRRPKTKTSRPQREEKKP
jgi:DNA-binding transcriptional ArsR family regulator